MAQARPESSLRKRTGTCWLAMFIVMLISLIISKYYPRFLPDSTKAGSPGSRGAANQIARSDVSRQQIYSKMRRDDRDEIPDPKAGRGEDESKHKSGDQAARALIKYADAAPTLGRKAKRSCTKSRISAWRILLSRSGCLISVGRDVSAGGNSRRRLPVCGRRSKTSKRFLSWHR